MPETSLQPTRAARGENARHLLAPGKPNQHIMAPAALSTTRAAASQGPAKIDSGWQTSGMEADEIGPSLLAAFARVPDVRSHLGRQYPLPALLPLATAAMLCGARGLYAMAQWGRLQPEAVRRALGLWGARMPGVTTLHYVSSASTSPPSRWRCTSGPRKHPTQAPTAGCPREHPSRQLRFGGGAHLLWGCRPRGVAGERRCSRLPYDRTVTSRHRLLPEHAIHLCHALLQLTLCGQDG